MRSTPTRGKLNQWVVRGGRCLNCCTRAIQESSRLVAELAEAVQDRDPGAIGFVPAPPRTPEIVLPRTQPVIRKLPIGRTVGPGVLVLIAALPLERMLAAIEVQTLVSMLLLTSDAVLRTTEGCEDCIREQLLGQDTPQERETVRYAKRQ